MAKKTFIASLLFFLAVLVCFAAYKFFSPKHKNAIVIMIDTFRADHIGAYGYKRDTTPNLDKFAEQNVRAARAIAVAPWTPPSVASILTGLSVARHGHSPNLLESEAKKRGQLLRDDLDTLPEILKGYGYQTAGITTNPWITEEFNFKQGFDDFHHERRASTDKIFASAKNYVSKFLSKPATPFFLYVHVLDPHGPYTPKGKYANMFSGAVEGTFPYDEKTQLIINRYDAEIRMVDDYVGDFFQYLKEHGLYEDTEIIIVSDHGEQFQEHGESGHGKMLHIEEVHVPFLAKCQKRKEVIEDVVSNLDVTPTMLDCLGLRPRNNFDGVSIIDPKKVKERTGAFSSVNRAFIQEAFTTLDGMRIINSKGRAKSPSSTWEVVGTYNLDKDPHELNPGFEASLISELNGYLNSTKAAQTPLKEVESKITDVSEDSVKQLESLGYINE